MDEGEDEDGEGANRREVVVVYDLYGVNYNQSMSIIATEELAKTNQVQ